MDDPRRPRDAHQHPPVTPAGVLLNHAGIVASVVFASISLAVLATYDGGSVLLHIDRPVQHWVEAHRTSSLDTVFSQLTRFGDNVVVFPVAALLVLIIVRRCRSLALSLAVAVLARSPIEFIVKELLDRDRPDFDRMFPGTGPSHPSGHVLAAVSLWGLLPPLVALFTRSRVWWWVSVAAGAVLIVGISTSRVYVGVHWPTDIIQGWLLGALYLVAIQAIFDSHHRHRTCDAVIADLALPTPPAPQTSRRDDDVPDVIIQ